MIAELILKFGSAPGLAPARLPAAPVTVFVGPNNSGKSKVLNEIWEFAHQGRENANALIVDRIGFERMSFEEAKSAIAPITVNPHQNEQLNPGHIFLQSSLIGRMQVSLNDLMNSLQNPSA